MEDSIGARVRKDKASVRSASMPLAPRAPRAPPAAVTVPAAPDVAAFARPHEQARLAARYLRTTCARARRRLT
jgi:hypothetical protein